MGFASIRTLLVALTVSSSVVAESPFDTYKETKRLPSTCPDGYTAGSDTALLTVPYTYSQVLSVIGSFKNLTWSGVKDEDVTLNGTDNTVGTARTYKGEGTEIVETLSLYMKPSKGPFAEVYTTAPLTVPASNVSVYAPYNAIFAGPTCNGSATLINSTVEFCATDAKLTASGFHSIHLSNAAGIGKLLGGLNFTTCAVLGNSTSNSTNTTTTRSASSSTVAPTSTSIAPSSTAPPATTTTAAAKGEAGTLAGSAVFAGLMALGAIFL